MLITFRYGIVDEDVIVSFFRGGDGKMYVRTNCELLVRDPTMSGTKSRPFKKPFKKPLKNHLKMIRPLKNHLKICFLNGTI